MKKIVKIINALLIVMMLFTVLGTSVQATNPGMILDKINPDYGKDTGNLTGIGQTIISWISIAGVVISVVVLTILGIKYMIGSASEKAEYKKTMIPYLVGAVLIFGASAIAGVVVNMVSGLSTTGTGV